jgi:hypothetical protein
MFQVRKPGVAISLVAALCAAVFSGCGGGAPAAPKAPAPPPIAGPAPPPVAVPGQPPPVATAPLPPTVVEKAQVGLTKKGDYGSPDPVGLTKKGDYGSPDPISTPISALWRAQERVVLLQVQQAMQLFETTEGRKPKSHAEFMDKVINLNGIRLPMLPPGHTYLYDPKQGELMVERPR